MTMIRRRSPVIERGRGGVVDVVMGGWATTEPGTEPSFCSSLTFESSSTATLPSGQYALAGLGTLLALCSAKGAAVDESNLLGALTGLAGADLYVASAFAPGSAPKPDASTAQVVAHYVDKRGPLLVAALLAAIAMASLLWFLGYVKVTLERAGRPGPRLATVTVAAWVAFFVIASVGGMLSIAIIWRGANSFDPKVVQLTYDVENLTYR